MPRMGGSRSRGRTFSPATAVAARFVDCWTFRSRVFRSMCATCWSISKSTSTSRTRATILTSPIFPTQRNGWCWFVGDVGSLEVINTVIYRVHHRVASEWRRDRVFLMGDAAHLITPMWALGLNTGILDAINLPWRLAWVSRGWASEGLLDGYGA